MADSILSVVCYASACFLGYVAGRRIEQRSYRWAVPLAMAALYSLGKALQHG